MKDILECFKVNVLWIWLSGGLVPLYLNMCVLGSKVPEGNIYITYTWSMWGILSLHVEWFSSYYPQPISRAQSQYGFWWLHTEICTKSGTKVICKLGYLLQLVLHAWYINIFECGTNICSSRSIEKQNLSIDINCMWCACGAYEKYNYIKKYITHTSYEASYIYIYHQ